MTVRAFVIGLLAVAGLTLLAPYTSFIKGYGWIASSAFPTGAVVIVVFLTVAVNLVVKLVRRSWVLSQAELMLVWCMLIVSCAIPVGGIGRFWYTMLASGPYMARRPDIQWEEDGSLTQTPDGLALSKNPKSEAARRYYEGAGERGRVPWRFWLPPLARWTVFLLLLYVAVFFVCGILRRQWVEVERLMFPLARVPLQFTEGSASDGLLPALFTEKAFVAGVVATTAFRLLRALPVLFGAGSGWGLTVPFADVFRDTALEQVGFGNVPIQLTVVGLAFLVPADVSLSVWFFFLFSRFEILVGHWLALPSAGGDTWSPLMRWQQFGAYVVFTLGMLYMARRHLMGVLGKALGFGGADDSEEPIGYRLAFWGFLVAVAGCLVWYAAHGVRITTGAFMLALMFCSFLVYARVVAQGGVPVARNLWIMPRVMEGLGGAAMFTPAGAVVASMQSNLLVRNASTMLAPMAMNSFRISEVFGRRRRWLLPALFVSLVLAMVCTTYIVLTQAYDQGVMNFAQVYWPQNMGQAVWNEAARIIERRPASGTEHFLGPMVFGGGLMAVLMFMRARFYWWPVHAIGLLTCSSWNIVNRMWFPFFLGWLAKTGIMRLAGGRTLRQARRFFIALIVTESFFSGLSVLLQTASGGVIPGF